VTSTAASKSSLTRYIQNFPAQVEAMNALHAKQRRKAHTSREMKRRIALSTLASVKTTLLVVSALLGLCDKPNRVTSWVRRRGFGVRSDNKCSALTECTTDEASPRLCTSPASTKSRQP
jgi:hypothetical protein